MIIKQPGVDKYLPVRKEICFSVEECNPEETLEVEIIGPEHRKMGAKTLSGQQKYSVNVSDYIDHLIEVEPVTEYKNTISEATTRTAQVRIKADGNLSDPLYATAGSQVAESWKMLSNCGAKRKIAFGESDEIAFFAPGNVYGEIVFEGEVDTIVIDFSAPQSHYMKVVCIDPMQVVDQIFEEYKDYLEEDQWEELRSEIIADFKRVVINANGEQLAEYEVVKRGGSAVRVAWINRFGAIDQFSFYESSKQKYSVGKVKAISQKAIVTTNVNSQLWRYLKSGYVESKTAKWIAEIIEAPKVWVVSGQEFVPVEVISDSVEYVSDRPTCIEIVCSHSEK